MSFRILDATTKSAYLAAASQRAQLQVLVDALGATPFARIYAGDTLLRTQTLPALTINNTSTPYSITLGLSLADTHIATGTPSKLVLRAGSTDIVEMSCSVGGGSGDVDFVGAIKVLCKPTFDGVTLIADAALPAGDVYGNVRIAIWGQSNALGRALRSDIAATPLTLDPVLEDYDTGVLPFSRVMIWTGSAYATLQPGVNTGASSDQFGPEFGLATRWMRETASGTLYLEKAASSGVSITNFDPPSGANYAPGVAERGQANTWLAGQSVTLTADHLLWVQGESDAAQTQSWYETRLQEMLDALHANSFLDAPTSRIVLSQMHPSTSTYGAGVAAAKAAIAAATSSRIAAIEIPYYMKVGDNIHYNGRGQVQHAYDAYAWLLNAAEKAT